LEIQYIEVLSESIPAIRKRGEMIKKATGIMAYQSIGALLIELADDP
jgi:hypothetical protein